MKQSEVDTFFREMSARNARARTEMFYWGVIVGLAIGLTVGASIYLVAT